MMTDLEHRAAYVKTFGKDPLLCFLVRISHATYCTVFRRCLQA